MCSSQLSEPSSAQGKTIRTVAVIDDSDHDEFFIRRTLRMAGISANIIRLPGGQDAIDYFSRAGRYANSMLYPAADLALLDINMPRVSGFDVLAWFNQQPENPRPLIAMLSSSALPRDREKALALGADEYLVKPLSVAILQNFVASHGMEWFFAARDGRPL